jgi:hypothetical protein
MERAAWIAGSVLCACVLGCGADPTDPSAEEPSRAGEYCAARTDCMGGTALDVEACTVAIRANDDRAEVFGCSSEHAAWFECLVEESVCEGGFYEEQGLCPSDAFADCLDSASTVASPPQVSESAETYCAAVCACETCSEIEQADCLLATEEDIDTASAYGCSAAELIECATLHGECTDGYYDWLTECDMPRSALAECIDGAAG